MHTNTPTRAAALAARDLSDEALVSVLTHGADDTSRDGREHLAAAMREAAQRIARAARSKGAGRG